MKPIFSHSLILVCLSAWTPVIPQNPVTLPPAGLTDGAIQNRFVYYGDAEKTYEKLFLSLDTLVMKGEGNLNFVHIGDSHIQAGFLPEQMRQDFSSFISSGCGSRGLIFPYRIAKTNNPTDYFVKFTGNWEYCRNVEVKKNCSLGLTGILVKTRDTVSGMTFHFRETATFRDFNFIRIYHDTLDTTFLLDFPGLEGKYRVLLPLHDGFTDYAFDSFQDSLKIRIIKKDTLNKYFTLYGIDFETGDPGISYSSVGINGAEVTSFLRCDRLNEQLNRMKPDWIVISLGTNDAYALTFDKNQFTLDYLMLIRAIRKACPGIPVVLTVPGDSFRRRRYDNLNIPSVREAIVQVATETDCAVWDFYSLMGGAKSILHWHKAGLVARDKLHFSKQGYVIQADLLFGAFLDAYTSFIDKTTQIH